MIRDLEKSNEMLNGLIRSAPLAILAVDSDRKLAIWNPAAENLFGWTEEEVLGRSLPIVSEKQKAEVEELQRRVSNGEVISGHETKRLRKDGALVDVRISTTMLGEVDEQFGGYLLALFEDISDRKRMEKELIHSNQRFEDVARASGEWFWETDTQGRYTYCSSAAEKILGYGSEELVSRYFYDFFHPDDREELKKATFNVFKRRGSFRNFLNKYIHRDGRTVFLETSGFPIVNERGTFIGYRGSDRDVTERIAAEKKLTDSEDKFRSLFENMSEGFAYHEMIYDDNGTAVDYIFIEVNEAFEHMTGLKGSDILGRRVTEVIPGIEEDEIDWIQKYGKVADTGKEVVFEQYSDSLERWYLVHAYCPGKGHFATIILDITERKRAEKDLRDSEERFRLAFQLNPDAICLSTLDEGIIVDANEFMGVLFGYRVEEMLGKAELELGIWKNEKNRKHLLTELMKYQRTRNAHELELLDRNGTTVHVLLSATVISLAGIPHILSILKDVSVIRSYEKTVNQLTDGALGLTGSSLFLNLAQSLYEILNPDYIIISEIDPPAETTTSLAFIAQDVVGENFTYDLEETPCLEVLKSGKPQVYKNSLQRYFPEDRVLVDLEAEGYVGVPLRDFEGSVIGILCALYKGQVSHAEMAMKIMQAVSVKLSSEIIRIRTEKILKRNSHLATVGQVASGIAHEINNPLATISACAESLNARLHQSGGVITLDSGTVFKDYLDIIQKEVEYSSSIINDLLDFSRHRSDKVTTFNLNELIESTVRLIQMQRRSQGYSFKMDLDVQIPEYDADKDRIRQVLIIIFTNAIEAMPEGGAVKVRTVWKPDLGEIRISIADHGGGIRKGVIKRIFEPFFTTKSENKGTGLGLYLAFSIVAGHTGHIDVKSREGSGTTFTIRLPLQAAEMKGKDPVK